MKWRLGRHNAYYLEDGTIYATAFQRSNGFYWWNFITHAADGPFESMSLAKAAAEAWAATVHK